MQKVRGHMTTLLMSPQRPLEACTVQSLAADSSEPRKVLLDLAHADLKVNDLVMLVPGCHVPITLRASVFVKDREIVKYDSHMEIEVCLGLGCAKNGIVVAQRYEVIGETCKYLYPYEVTQKLRYHRSSWGDEW